MNQAKRDLYLNALRQAGKRITDQRRTICEYLAATESHPTPYQVFQELSTQYPDMSRATVYNTLNVLKELGAIVEIGFGADHTRYDTDTEPHINLVCLRCHEISDYEGPLPFADVQQRLTRQEGFLPMVMRVDILGFCKKCRERKKAEIREQWLARRERQTGTAATATPSMEMAEGEL
jgi:Fur family peroxide stress response transcriptional regulator